MTDFKVTYWMILKYNNLTHYSYTLYSTPHVIY